MPEKGGDVGKPALVDPARPLPIRGGMVGVVGDPVFDAFDQLFFECQAGGVVGVVMVVVVVVVVVIVMVVIVVMGVIRHRCFPFDRFAVVVGLDYPAWTG